eukprot:TRINITY_DN1342_c0_g1_i1.p1 TRINITY_DN1342_c0_g1~~TRINITY_DN1342_c0_g1_i1.p1  ORF type:complete len:131 (-),score=27.18 TRINITY_DN1342_c0_g1_i1:64-456(-)
MEKHCNRSYGSEGALKMHIKLKHPKVKYNADYQYLVTQKIAEKEEMKARLAENKAKQSNFVVTETVKMPLPSLIKPVFNRAPQNLMGSFRPAFQPVNNTTGNISFLPAPQGNIHSSTPQKMSIDNITNPF